MSKKHKLNWEYCECGCHQHTASIAGVHYSMFNDLKGGYFLGVNSHRAYWREDGNLKFKSFEDADEAAWKDAQKRIGRTPGVVSEAEVRKLIRRAQRHRKQAEELMQTYLRKKDNVGYEGAMKEAAAFGKMAEDLKKLCEVQ